jgi:hypothetical protein
MPCRDAGWETGYRRSAGGNGNRIRGVSDYMAFSRQEGTTAPPRPGGSTSRRYLLALIGASVTILIAGIWLRPPDAPPPPVSESESLRLQMQAQRRDLERRALFFSTRARELVSIAEQARSRPDSVPIAQAKSGERLIVLAASSGGDPVWWDTAVAGAARRNCNGMAAEEIVVASPLAAVFAGGAAFTLDGGLVGLIAQCGEESTLLTPKAFAAQAEAAPARDLYEAEGLRVRLERAPGREGARVLELRRTSAYLAAGLQAGDLIMEVNGEPLTSIEQLGAAAAPAALEMRVLRGTRELEIRSGPRTSGSGIRWLLRGRSAEVASVAAGSPGARWGLRTGDVVLRAGPRRYPRPAVVDELLSRSDIADLVVLRGASELWLEGPQ